MPGSQTELTLVTADFVKIYDLSIDKISPIYYFLLPMGKIKDVTFVYSMRTSASPGKKDELSDEIGTCTLEKYIVIMTSCGYLYYEMLSELTSSAKNGVYYVTSTIEFNPMPPKTAEAASTPTSTSGSNDKEKSSSSASENLLGGGVSVYYSSKMQLLFWSYLQGKTFIGSFKPNTLVIDVLLFRFQLLEYNSITKKK